MRKLAVIATFAVVLLAVTSTALADGIAFPFPTTYQAKYLNYEGFFTPQGVMDTTVRVGDINSGFAVLQQIAPLLDPNTPGPNTYFWNGVGGGGSQVTATFTGITVTQILDTTAGISVTAITPGSGGQGPNDTYDIRSTGGTLNLYSNINNIFNPANPLTASDPGLGNVLEAQFNFIPGILATAPTITVDGVTTATSPLTGKASSYAAVILNGLPWADLMNGNAIPFQTFPAGADFFNTSDFQALTTPTANYSFTSNDPIIGTTAIPEPASLLLLGGGLVVVALVGRKRFAKKN